MKIQIYAAVIVGVTLGLTAAVLAARAWAGLGRAWAARSWPRTTGQVRWSGVERVMVRVRSSTGGPTRRLRPAYRARVIYSYTVGGGLYESDRIHFGPAVLTSGDAGPARAAARYPPGSAVTVIYNPADPQEAALEARAGWGSHILWISALVVLLCAAATVVTLLWD